MDVFVECSPGNARNLQAACNEFGLGSTLSDKTFQEPGVILRFGVPPMRLEILNEISGVTFEECWSSRETFKLNDVEIPVISLSKLIKNKQASGRTKDRVDAEYLSKGV